MTPKQRLAEHYRAADLDAAKIVIEDPQLHPGLMQEWVRLVLNPLVERTSPAIRRVA